MKTFHVIDTDDSEVMLRGSHDECVKWVADHDGDPCYVIRAEHEVVNWERDDYQFPRLLAEILAVSHDKLDYDALCESMDVVPGELHELFDRADAAWERVKRETCR